MHRTLLLLAVVLTTSCVRADVVYNNLGPGDTFSASGRILIGPDAGVFSDVNQAASFSVGPTAHHLTDVVLGLGVNEYPVKPFVSSWSTCTLLPTQRGRRARYCSPYLTASPPWAIRQLQFKMPVRCCWLPTPMTE